MYLQDKLKSREGTQQHIAGASAGQVSGAVINRELMIYLFMYMSFINCIRDTESNGRAIMNYEGRDLDVSEGIWLEINRKTTDINNHLRAEPTTREY
jgi:hypothetical protein